MGPGFCRGLPSLLKSGRFVPTGTPGFLGAVCFSPAFLLFDEALVFFEVSVILAVLLSVDAERATQASVEASEDTLGSEEFQGLALRELVTDCFAVSPALSPVATEPNALASTEVSANTSDAEGGSALSRASADVCSDSVFDAFFF